MVNLRYHIVSITAVFLALAIGIAVGTTVIDKATVDTLKNRLENLEKRIDNTEAENQALRDELDDATQLLGDLGEEGAQLLDGRLVGVPVVFVAVRGVHGDSLEAARRAVVDAGAAYGGTLWLTDRLRLDDDSEIADLSAILGGSTTNSGRLRQTLARRLADALMEAASVPEESTEEPAPSGTTTVVPDEGSADGSASENGAPVEEPAVLADLRDAGFVDYEPADGSSSDVVVLLPGLRFVFVSGAGAEIADTDFVVPLLGEMAGDGLAPVVAASAATGATREDIEATRSVFVGLVRGDERLRASVSTVDDLESFVGWAAVVLAVRALGLDERGHFGVGEGADRLLPAT